MIRCWHPAPEQRPTAAQVVAALPATLPNDKGPVVEGNAESLHADLQERYEGYRDSALVEGLSPRMSSEDVGVEDEVRVRSPSPLIHRSLVGLTKRDSAEVNGVLGTVSSKPSNYTSSGTSSTRSARSGKRSPAAPPLSRDHPAFVHELFTPPPPDDGPLPPTMIETPRHSRDLGECGDSGVPDDYLQIGPVLGRPEASRGSRGSGAPKKSLSAQDAERLSVRDRHRSSWEGERERSATNSPSLERRKSAVALALEGVSSLDEVSRVSPESAMDTPLWVQSVHRRSATLSSTARSSGRASDPSSLSSVVSADASQRLGQDNDNVPLAAVVRARGSTASRAQSRSDKGKSFSTLALDGSQGGSQLPVSGHTGQWGDDSAHARAKADVDAHRLSGGHAADADANIKPSKDTGTGVGKGGGWFKRSRRSSSSLVTDERTLHSSPEPGALPEGPSWRHKPLLAQSTDDARGGDKSPSSPLHNTRGEKPPWAARPPQRESVSSTSGSLSLSGGLTLTSSALHRIEKRRSSDLQTL